MESVRNADYQIETFEDIRTIIAEETFWKINEFPMHKRYPSLQSTDLHLQRKQKVYFDDEDEMVEIMNEAPKETKLTAFLK